jgi:hypothetical protein
VIEEIDMNEEQKQALVREMNKLVAQLNTIIRELDRIDQILKEVK